MLAHETGETLADASDIESQATHGSRQRDRRPFVIPDCAADEPVQKACEDAGLNVAWRAGTPHPHAFLRVGRAHLEREMHKLVMRIRETTEGEHPILNVAPNARREDGYYAKGDYADARVIWHNIPLVQPNDVGRSQSADRLGLTNRCTHLWGECTCVTPSVVASSHAVYYASAEALACCLMRTTTKLGYVVLNRHVGICGRHPHGEGHWRLATDGNVHDYVRGNERPYVHPHTARFFASGSIRARGFEVLTETVDVFGDTNLVRLELVPSLVQSPASISLDAVLDGDHDMVTGVVAAGPSPTAIALKVERIEVLGGGAVLEFAERDVKGIVPLAAVGAVATHLVGQARDAAAMRDAIYHSRQWMKRNYGDAMELGMDLEAIVMLVATLALTRSVHREAELMAAFQTRFKYAFDAYNRLIAWQPLTRVPVWLLIAAVVGACVAVVALWAGVPEYHHAAALALAAATLTFVVGVLFIRRARNRHLSWVARNWARDAVNGDLRDVVEPTSLTAPFLAGHTVFREVDPLQVRRGENDRLLVGPDPKPPKHPGAPVPRSEIVGLQTDQQLPLVVEPSQDAEVSGLAARVMRVVPPPSDEGLLEELVIIREHPWFEPYRDLVLELPTNLTARWIGREHVTEAERKRMRKALEVVKAEGLSRPDFLKDAFVKVEKTLKTVTKENGQKPVKPRIIQALRDKLKVFISPEIWYWAKMIRRAFDGKSGVMFSSSRSAEEVGEALCRAWHSCESPAAWKADHETYDACNGVVFKEVIGEAMAHNGVSEDVVGAWRASKPEGVTVHGVRYETDDGLCSGSPETNDGGSFRNAASTLAVWACLGRLWGARPVLLLVNGDDGGGILDVPVSVKLDSLALAARARYRNAHGLISDATLVRDPWDFEYSSFIPIPVRGPSGTTWKMSPKPGRAIAKLASKRTDQRTSNLAADVASVWQGANHVPFLRRVLECYRRLLAGVAPKGKPDSEPHKMHSLGLAVLDESAWTWMKGRYGLTHDDEVDLESYLAGVTSLPVVLSHRVLSRLMEVDCE